MLIKDTYASIAGRSDGLFKDNGSRFIAQAYPVESEEEVKEIVGSLKKEYHDARHHCFAYRLGLDGSRWRANDDGEPSGSAGRPILGQIDAAGLSDILVVVIRYHMAMAAEDPEVPVLVRGDERNSYGDVMKVVKDMSLPQKDQYFAERCSMLLRVRLSQEAAFLDRVSNIEGVDVDEVKI